MINIGKQPRWTAQCKSTRRPGNQSLSVCGLANLPISHKVQMWLISNPGQMWQRGEGESRSRPTLLLLLLHLRNSCARLKKEGKWLNLCCPLMTYWLYIIMEVNTLTRACEPAAISCSLVTFFLFFCVLNCDCVSWMDTAVQCRLHIWLIGESVPPGSECKVNGGHH